MWAHLCWSYWESFAGCKEGIGKGTYSGFGVAGGAGHGGRGGSGFYNGRLSEGGKKYGDPDLPCEVGSGSGGPGGYMGQTSGGGMIGNTSSTLVWFCVL